MMMVGLSKASSYVIVTSGLPQMLLDLVPAITNNRLVVLLLLNILFLIIGMLMEANAAIVMMTPLLTSLMAAYQIDPLQFGIVMSFNLCIGLVTPPVGLTMLMSTQIAETSVSKTMRSLMPMLLLSIAVLMLITYVPQITTWLPSMIN
jgi:C4-dicarboxylate transporter DctM subunit